MKRLMLAVLAALLPGIASAQPYPSKPVIIINPFTAGGPIELLARAVGQKLNEAWGQPVLVETRAGAAGNIGIEYAAKAPADGYTLLVLPTGNAVVNPHLFPKLPYDSFRDFAPVTLLATVENVLVVHPSVNARSVQELIALAKANPGKLSFSSGGVGTQAHIAGEMLKSLAGVEIYRLSAPDLGELERAIAHARGTGKPVTRLAREDFPLPSLDATLARIAEEVDAGRGFHLIRGFPGARLAAEDSAIALWGIALRFGSVISQNAFGDLVGHVRDAGRKIGEKDVRGYDTNAELRFHNDECDIIALMCLCTAKEGGLSSVVSSTQVFNRLLETRPAVLPKLFDGYVFSLMGEQRAGVGPVSEHRIPIFSWHDRRLSCRYTINTVLQASQYGVELTDEERAILFAPLEAARAPGVALTFALEAGDIQLNNNLCTLHQRTHYVDWEAPERKRHLLRVWLASHHPRPLAREFEERFNGGYSFRRGIPVTKAREAA